MKRKDNKRFGLEKFEIAKLTNARKIYGGFIDDDDSRSNNRTDNETVTDTLFPQSTRVCFPDENSIFITTSV